MIARAAPRIFISAGEPSGDLHGAGVVRALRLRYPEAVIDALGGPRMAEAGATIRYSMEGSRVRMSRGRYQSPRQGLDAIRIPDATIWSILSDYPSIE